MSSSAISENEDDPLALSSDDDWSTASDKKTGRRVSKRLTKKPRVHRGKLAEDNTSDSSAGETAKRTKNGMNKKLKVAKKGASSRKVSDKRQKILALGFNTGCFVILKKDVQVGDPKKPPCIWRVDGKALLQKYEAFEDSGVIRHKNTSIYTGWSPLDQDLYAPVEVTLLPNCRANIVELTWDKLKDIILDSD